ncbi:DUF4099 domain-containing protein [Niabella hirudinis]|uniref:DUF4099 domain-containing protein n=1 Tax=Niabella hirudinis TaxID=1285929 RepID=UPI003EBF9F64
MKYSKEQLPWQDFAVLGLDRPQVLSFPKSTIDALLSGNRTSLMRFENAKIPGMSSSYPIDGKLSLKKGTDGQLQLLIHPINPELKNNFELSKSELKYLESGKMVFIPKLVTGEDGKLEEALVAYDQVTNELVAFKREGLKAPNTINGTKLTPQQQKDFVMGKSITVNGDNYQIDPNNETAGVKKQAGAIRERPQTINNKYRSPELIMDIMLLTTGLGHYVLLWHLAKMLLHSRSLGFSLEKSLHNRSFRNSLADAQKEIVQKQQELSRQGVDKDGKATKTLSMDELIGIIEKKAGEHIVIDKIESGKQEAAGGQSVAVIQKKEGPSGGPSIRDEEPRSRSFKV